MMSCTILLFGKGENVLNKQQKKSRSLKKKELNLSNENTKEMRDVVPAETTCMTCKLFSSYKSVTGIKLAHRSYICI